MNVKVKYTALIIAITFVMTILTPLSSDIRPFGPDIAKAAEETVTLQNGLDNYNGSIDVSMFREAASDSWMAYAAEGTSGSLNMYDTTPYCYNALIYFDVSQVPAGATITSAKLELYKYWGTMGNGDIDFCRITDPDNKGMWVEGGMPDDNTYQSTGAAYLKRQGNGTDRSGDVGWTNTAGSSILDSIAPLSGTMVFDDTTSGAGMWHSIDLTTDVQKWVNGTEVNQGWYMRTRAGSGLHVAFASNQVENNGDANNDTTKRPILTITYTTGGTPTQSPENSVIPSPTVTTTQTTTPTATAINPTPSPTSSATPTNTTSQGPQPTPTKSSTIINNTYYLAPDGNDSANGSEATPWKTFWHASRSVQAGDTVIVRGGTYTDDALWSYSTGTADAPITFKAAEGETPVITGSGVYSQILHFQSENQYFIIDGITTDNTSGTSPVCAYDASHVILRNCTFKNNAGEASVAMTLNHCSYWTIENCVINTTGGSLQGDGEGDGIYVNAGNHNLIQNNYFTKCGHYATDFKDYNDAGATTSYDNIFRNNVIEQYWGGGVGMIFGAHNNLVENNTITYVGMQCTYTKTGVQIAADKNIVRNNVIGWSSDGSQGGDIDDSISLLSYRLNGMNQNCTDNRIYNNISYKAGNRPVMLSEKGDTIVTGNKVCNNIFYYNKTAGTAEDWWPAGNWYLLVETYHSTSYNVWNTSFPRNNSFYNNIWKHADSTATDYTNIPMFYFDGGQVSSKAFGKSLNQMQADYPTYFYGNLEKAPDFVNADAGDFSLQQGSPAIDSGADLAKTTAAGTDTTTVPVDDALFFSDGYGIADGDLIMIGNAQQQVNITAIDYDANTLTVSAPVTFAAGDSVNLAYKGEHPDMGVVESEYTAGPTESVSPSPTGTPTTSSPSPTPTTPEPTPQVTFPDVSAANLSWAVNEIQTLATEGIIKGTTDGNGNIIYDPYAQVTRAQLTKLIVEAFKIDGSGSDATFSDVPSTAWYYDYVGKAYKNKIINGTSADTFGPDNPITRQDMACIIIRAMVKYKQVSLEADESKLTKFADKDSIADYARINVATAVNLGIIKGTNQGSDVIFAPKDNTNRAQAAVVVYRMLYNE